MKFGLKSYSRFLAALYLIGFPMWANAKDPVTFEQNGSPDFFFGKTKDNDLVAGSLASTHTIVGRLIAISVRAAGVSGDYRIFTQTGTVSGLNVPDPYGIVGSSVTTIIGGAEDKWEIKNPAYNPRVVVSNLAAGTTIYVKMHYEKNQALISSNSMTAPF